MWTVCRSVVVVVLVACTSSAQPTAPKPVAAPVAALAALPGVIKLEPSGSVTVYASRAAATRATVLGDMAIAMLEHWRAVLGGSPLVVVLAVLDEVDWKTVTRRPYGFPHGERDQPWILYMPAEPARSVVAVSMAPIVGPERAATMVDNIVAHEIGHVIAVERLHGPDPQPIVRWFKELTATYFAYAYLRAKQPERAAVWDAVTELVMSGPRPAQATLSAFEQVKNPRDYTWYQLAFSRQVKVVYDQHGDAFVVAMRAKLPWPRQAVWSPDELLERLEPIAPGFTSWASW
jgi:hypothetical protein